MYDYFHRQLPKRRYLRADDVPAGSFATILHRGHTESKEYDYILPAVQGVGSVPNCLNVSGTQS